MRFWKDKWCGDESLYVSFPFLFTLSISKEEWVEDVWNFEGEGHHGFPVSLGHLMIKKWKVQNTFC